MTSTGRILLSATDFLSSFGLEFPREDAELIVATVTKTGRTHLMTHPEQLLTPKEERDAWRWLEKRARHYPIQYMRGFQEFYGNEFLVSPSVLVPRPETELLIDVSLEQLERKDTGRILDVGTGSGCIAITLLLKLPSFSAVATDIMASALIIARANGRRHSCSDRLRLLHGDAAQPVLGERKKFDLIVSNPPYVAASEIDAVSPSVARFEPSVAVFAGASGLEVIEKLFEQASDLLTDRGALILELSRGQNDRASALGRTHGWVQTGLRKDLAGIERCAVFRRAQ